MALLHIRGDGCFQKLPAESFFRDPPKQARHVIIITSSGVHVEIRIAVRHIKIANHKLRIEVRRVLYICVTMPLLSRAKQNMHPVLSVVVCTIGIR